MDIHTERKNQDELERNHKRNFENPRLMRQIWLVYIFLGKLVYASSF